MVICTILDLAEFIREMAENFQTFGGSPIFSYGHPDLSTRKGGCERGELRDCHRRKLMILKSINIKKYVEKN